MKPELSIYNTSHLDSKIKSSLGKTAKAINNPFTPYLSENTINTQLQPKLKLINEDFRNPKHYIDEDLNVKIVKTPRGLQLHSRSKYISPRLSNSAPLKFESLDSKVSGKKLEDRLSNLNLKMNEMDLVTPRSKSRFSATEEYKRQQHLVYNEYLHNYHNYYNLHNMKYLYDDYGSSRGGSLDSYRLHTVPPALAAYYSNRSRVEDDSLLGSLANRSIRYGNDLPLRYRLPYNQVIYPPYFSNDSLNLTSPQQKNGDQVYEERKKNSEEKTQGSVVESLNDIQNDDFLQRQDTEEELPRSGSSYAKLRKNYINRKYYGDKSESRY
ncbi:uncharacterized protein LOC100203554 [Hydra vulgaris]|uniref:Uncharacterized protein LOC100203554 n=1 Tax=Hydra vulgaris TaxID=6087 RepID=A0ABM4B838_HYDVU